MYKIRLQRYFLKLCNKWAKWQGLSVDIRILSTKGCLPLPWGYIHVEKHLKMCIKSELKEICLKLATNGQSDKGFLLTSKVCPEGVFCPCPGATYMYKIIKNVYKIRFRKDHFETCIIWAKRIGLSVVIKFLSPLGCLPLPGAIYMWKKHIKNGKKSDFKEILFKLATNGQSDKELLLTSKFCPQGVVCPCPGAIYMYNII